jgi:hypothetical protein
VSETSFEKKLPQQLVQFEIFDTPVWRLLALTIVALVLWILAGLLSSALVIVVRQVANASAFCGPLRIGLAVAGFRATMEIAPLATPARLHVERALGLTFFLAVAWAGAVVINLLQSVGFPGWTLECRQ